MKVAIILISMTLSVIALRADPNAKQEQPIERSSRDEKGNKIINDYGSDLNGSNCCLGKK